MGDGWVVGKHYLDTAKSKWMYVLKRSDGPSFMEDFIRKEPQAQHESALQRFAFLTTESAGPLNRELWLESRERRGLSSNLRRESKETCCESLRICTKTGSQSISSSSRHMQDQTTICPSTTSNMRQTWQDMRQTVQGTMISERSRQLWMAPRLAT